MYSLHRIYGKVKHHTKNGNQIETRIIIIFSEHRTCLLYNSEHLIRLRVINVVIYYDNKYSLQENTLIITYMNKRFETPLSCTRIFCIRTLS